jgi:hypothetical protein
MKVHMLQNRPKRASTRLTMPRLSYDLTLGMSVCELQWLQAATYTQIPEAFESHDERCLVETKPKDDGLTEDTQSASLMTSPPSNRCNAT